jgi:hypothetical protein
MTYLKHYYFRSLLSRSSLVSIVTRLQAGRPGSIFGRGMEFFFFATASRPAVGPTQPPIQDVTRGGGALSPGVKRPSGEADHSPPSSAHAKNAWSYTHTSS